MNKRGNLQNVGYPVFFTPSAIAKLSFICDGEVTKSPTLNYQLRTLIVYHAPKTTPSQVLPYEGVMLLAVKC